MCRPLICCSAARLADVDQGICVVGLEIEPNQCLIYSSHHSDIAAACDFATPVSFFFNLVASLSRDVEAVALRRYGDTGEAAACRGSRRGAFAHRGTRRRSHRDRRERRAITRGVARSREFDPFQRRGQAIAGGRGPDGMRAFPPSALATEPTLAGEFLVARDFSEIRTPRLRRSTRDYRTQTRAPFTMRHLGATTAALGATTTALGATTTAAPTGRRATQPARTTPAAQ
jgi:hypothetical protein